MTYKKADFYSSPTMRQFSKIASDKGWLKSEKPIEKKASVASEPKGFIENAISLTAELRKQNNVVLNKLAEEIEYNLMQYKVASVYGVFNETGEDLVDQAHPDGSHKMEGMIGDAVIETVVDQQKKIHEVVFKKPKGKLANRELIELVKNASWFWNTDLEDKIKKEVIGLYNKNLKPQLNKIQNDIDNHFKSPVLDDIRTSNRDNTRVISIVHGFTASVGQSVYGVVGGLTENLYTHLTTLKNKLLSNAEVLNNELVNELIPNWKNQMVALIIHFNKLVDQYLVSLGSVGEAKEKAYKELQAIENPHTINSVIQSKIKDMNNKLSGIVTLVKTLQDYEAGSGKYAKEIVWLEKPFRNDLNKTIAEFSAAGNNLISGNEAKIEGNIINNSKQVEDIYNNHFRKSYALFDKFSQISS